MKIAKVVQKAILKQVGPLPENVLVAMPECCEIIAQHCGIAGASSQTPFQFSECLILMPSLIETCSRLNKVLGVSFSDGILLAFGRHMLSQIDQDITDVPSPFTIVVRKFFWNLFTLGMGIEAFTADTDLRRAAVTFILGVLYLKALLKTHTAGSISEKTLKDAIVDEIANKENIRELYIIGQRKMKSIDFSKFKDDAEGYVYANQI